MSSNPCIRDGCERQAAWRQRCKAHYNADLLAGVIWRRTSEERFWESVEPTGFCWTWTGNLNDAGYGRFGADGRLYLAHRYAYGLLVGPIPDGTELDHLCRTRRCVNPDHLDPVTQVVNNRRSFSWAGQNHRKTHCPQGHEYTPENTYLSRTNERHCRTCDRERTRERRAAAKKEVHSQ